MKNHYDVVIIGAGPIGLACAIEAQKAGLQYVVIDKGCLVNSLFHYPAHMTFFSTSERLEIGGIPFTTVNAKPNRLEAIEYYRRVAMFFCLQLRLFEKVIRVEKQENCFQVYTHKQQYSSRFVIVATGFYDMPVRLKVPGDDLPKVTHYYKEPHFYAFQNVVVVGGNNSAVDAALETWRKGAAVTMVMQEPTIGERVKYWVRPDIINRIEEGSIVAYYSSKITAIRPYDLDIETPRGLVTLANDFVIAMTGYQPDFSFLESMGVILSNDEKRYPYYDKTTMETNVAGLYLAGVVCGGMDTHVWFIENSRVHALQIMQAIQQKK